MDAGPKQKVSNRPSTRARTNESTTKSLLSSINNSFIPSDGLSCRQSGRLLQFRFIPKEPANPEICTKCSCRKTISLSSDENDNAWTEKQPRVGHTNFSFGTTTGPHHLTPDVPDVTNIPVIGDDNRVILCSTQAAQRYSSLEEGKCVPQSICHQLPALPSNSQELTDDLTRILNELNLHTKSKCSQSNNPTNEWKQICNDEGSIANKCYCCCENRKAKNRNKKARWIKRKQITNKYCQLENTCGNGPIMQIKGMAIPVYCGPSTSGNKQHSGRFTESLIPTRGFQVQDQSQYEYSGPVTTQTPDTKSKRSSRQSNIPRWRPPKKLNTRQGTGLLQINARKIRVKNVATTMTVYPKEQREINSGNDFVKMYPPRVENGSQVHNTTDNQASTPKNNDKEIQNQVQNTENYEATPHNRAKETQNQVQDSATDNYTSTPNNKDKETQNQVQSTTDHYVSTPNNKETQIDINTGTQTSMKSLEDLSHGSSQEIISVSAGNQTLQPYHIQRCYPVPCGMRNALTALVSMRRQYCCRRITCRFEGQLGV